MLSNEPAPCPPIGECAEFETQHVSLTPGTTNDHRAFPMRLASALGVDDRFDRGCAEPLARDPQSVRDNFTQAADPGELLDVRHLLRCQSAREHVEIVDPQEIARSRMMAGAVD